MSRNKTRKRISLTVASLIVGIFLIGIFLYQTPIQFSIQKPAESVSSAAFASPTYVFAKTGAEPNSPLPSPAVMLEVHIANNGDLLLRGARVVSISGQTIHASTAWNLVAFNWEIQTKLSTKFLTAKGQKETLANIQIGDTLTVNGKLIQGGTEPIIAAEYIRQ